MRSWMTLVLGLSIAGAGARAGFAQDAKATSKDPPAQAAQEKPADLAKLRAEMHRAMAALIEVQAAENPDAAKVKELTAKVQELRSKVCDRSAPRSRAWESRSNADGAALPPPTEGVATDGGRDSASRFHPPCPLCSHPCGVLRYTLPRGSA